MTYLVTGGAGFIGSNYTRHLLQHDQEASIIVLDSLSYAGHLSNLTDVLPFFGVFLPEPHRETGQIEFDSTGSITASFSMAETLKRWKSRLDGWSPVSLPRNALGRAVDEFLHSGRSRIAFVIGSSGDRFITDQLMPLADYVVNLAAETHVDRSIRNADSFLNSNVLGTYMLLESARTCQNVRKFLHVSTDEVYGSVEDGSCTEETPLHPRNPYSASKAAADHLVTAYHATYALPTLIVRPSNNFGPYQYPEKLIPLMVIRALSDHPLPVYGDGCQVRNWLHVENTSAALALVLQRGSCGEAYNISGGNESRNIDIVRTILAVLGKSERLINYISDRPGHDRRYEIDDTKIRRMGYLPSGTFTEQLKSTIKWYVQHREWWLPLIRDSEYHEFSAALYGNLKQR